MRRMWIFTSLILLALLVTPFFVLAQDVQPPEEEKRPLVIYTSYPSQVIGLGETITLNLTVYTDTAPQIVLLEVEGLPEGWTATFRGGGRTINSIYIEPDVDSSVDVRVEPPKEVQAGKYSFTIIAKGEGTQASLPIELTVQEKQPSRLTFETELPTLKGTPSTTFRYDASLRNEGDDELTVNLSAEAPGDFQVVFRLNGQDVNTIPIGPKETKRLSIEAQPIADVAAGTYPVTIRAQAGDVQAVLSLVAEVTGQSQLLVTAPDGRLSGTAYAGRETPLKIIVSNSGSAPARAVEVTASGPAGWTIEFDNPQISEIPAGEQVELTANIRPAQNAVAGDYMLTIRARPADGATRSADFRIAVLTSTLWGVVGIVLIAIAVGVVAMAVMRFGRR